MKLITPYGVALVDLFANGTDAGALPFPASSGAGS